jgi:hypothetical protein
MFLRAISFLAPAFLALGVSGCFFMDDDTQDPGYTDCGSFLGGGSCAPGQYCTDSTFSECAIGCLSDVNCASNQYCYKSSDYQVGICENSRATIYAQGLQADVGADVPTVSPDRGR